MNFVEKLEPIIQKLVDSDDLNQEFNNLIQRCFIIINDTSNNSSNQIIPTHIRLTNKGTLKLKIIDDKEDEYIEYYAAICTIDPYINEIINIYELDCDYEEEDFDNSKIYHIIKYYQSFVNKG